MTDTEYVIEYERGLDYMENLGGVSWFEAPKPPKRHECWPQTRGFMNVSFVERCACGAIRMHGSGWMEKNGVRGAYEHPRASRRYPPIWVWLLVAVVALVVTSPLAFVLDGWESIVATFAVGFLVGHFGYIWSSRQPS